MKWYYVEAGQQAGPVDEPVLEEMFANGRIRPDTLVWRDGMANWLPYAQAKPGAAAIPGAPPVISAGPRSAAAPTGDDVVCAECGGIFARDNAIQYGTVWVCANCKPTFLQKLQEGVSTGARGGRRALPVNPAALTEEILTRGYEIDIGRCISRGWQLVKGHLGATVGATLLVMLLSQGLGIIPIVGALAAMVIQGPLLGGLYLFYLKLIRGEEAGVGDAFSGFSKGFGRLFLTFILMALLLYVWILPAVIYAVATHQFSRQLPDALCLALILGALVPMAYLGVAFSFALPLAADLELGAWDALQVSRRVVTRKWLSVFGLILVAGLLSALGVLACLIGVIFTLPIFYAATMYAYEDIFSA